MNTMKNTLNLIKEHLDPQLDGLILKITEEDDDKLHVQVTTRMGTLLLDYVEVILGSEDSSKSSEFVIKQVQDIIQKVKSLKNAAAQHHNFKEVLKLSKFKGH